MALSARHRSVRIVRKRSPECRDNAVSATRDRGRKAMTTRWRMRPRGLLGAGATAALKDKAGRLHGIPWIADIFMAGAARYDLIEQAGKRMPDTFDDVLDMCKAVHGKAGVPAYLAENHYGWTFIPWLQGFGGD